MPEIKLARLADRTPVRLAISVAPDQHRLLSAYAEFYAAEHGATETLSDLIPAMLEGFVRGDRAFLKALKEGRIGRV